VARIQARIQESVRVMSTLLGTLMSRFAPGRKRAVIFCYAEGRDGDWEGFCLNFDLAVQGTSFDDVHTKISEAIEIYLEGVKALPKEDWARMLDRRAPLSVWLGPFLHLLATALTRRDDRLRHEFTLPTPLAMAMA